MSIETGLSGITEKPVSEMTVDELRIILERFIQTTKGALKLPQLDNSKALKSIDAIADRADQAVAALVYRAYGQKSPEDSPT